MWRSKARSSSLFFSYTFANSLSSYFFCSLAALAFLSASFLLLSISSDFLDSSPSKEYFTSANPWKSSKFLHFFYFLYLVILRFPKSAAYSFQLSTNAAYHAVSSNPHAISATRKVTSQVDRSLFYKNNQTLYAMQIISKNINAIPNNTPPLFSLPFFLLPNSISLLTLYALH